MKIETVEKLRDLARVGAAIESLLAQRKKLNEEHAENILKIRQEIEKLAAEREAILDDVHADESVAKDLRRKRGRKPAEGGNPAMAPAKKKGAKGDATV